MVIVSGDVDIAIPCMDDLSEALTQVMTNTTNNKNSGNCVLYENVKTIMSLPGSPNLKTLGYGTLNKFMVKSSENNNSKFAALNLLKSVINQDQSAVQ